MDPSAPAPGSDMDLDESLFHLYGAFDDTEVTSTNHSQSCGDQDSSEGALAAVEGTSASRIAKVPAQPTKPSPSQIPRLKKHTPPRTPEPQRYPVTDGPDDVDGDGQLESPLEKAETPSTGRSMRSGMANRLPRLSEHIEPEDMVRVSRTSTVGLDSELRSSTTSDLIDSYRNRDGTEPGLVQEYGKDRHEVTRVLSDAHLRLTRAQAGLENSGGAVSPQRDADQDTTREARDELHPNDAEKVSSAREYQVHRSLRRSPDWHEDFAPQYLHARRSVRPVDSHVSLDSAVRGTSLRNEYGPLPNTMHFEDGDSSPAVPQGNRYSPRNPMFDPAPAHHRPQLAAYSSDHLRADYHRGHAARGHPSLRLPESFVPRHNMADCPESMGSENCRQNADHAASISSRSTSKSSRGPHQRPHRTMGPLTSNQPDLPDIATDNGYPAFPARMERNRRQHVDEQYQAERYQYGENSFGNVHLFPEAYSASNRDVPASFNTSYASPNYHATAPRGRPRLVAPRHQMSYHGAPSRLDMSIPLYHPSNSRHGRHGHHQGLRELDDQALNRSEFRNSARSNQQRYVDGQYPAGLHGGMSRESGGEDPFRSYRSRHRDKSSTLNERGVQYQHEGAAVEDKSLDQDSREPKLPVVEPLTDNAAREGSVQYQGHGKTFSTTSQSEHREPQVKNEGSSSLGSIVEYANGLSNEAALTDHSTSPHVTFNTEVQPEQIAGDLSNDSSKGIPRIDSDTLGHMNPRPSDWTRKSHNETEYGPTTPTPLAMSAKTSFDTMKSASRTTMPRISKPADSSDEARVSSNFDEFRGILSFSEDPQQDTKAPKSKQVVPSPHFVEQLENPEVNNCMRLGAGNLTTEDPVSDADGAVFESKARQPKKFAIRNSYMRGLQDLDFDSGGHDVASGLVDPSNDFSVNKVESPPTKFKLRNIGQRIRSRSPKQASSSPRDSEGKNGSVKSFRSFFLRSKRSYTEAPEDSKSLSSPVELPNVSASLGMEIDVVPKKMVATKESTQGGVCKATRRARALSLDHVVTPSSSCMRTADVPVRHSFTGDASREVGSREGESRTAFQAAKHRAGMHLKKYWRRGGGALKKMLGAKSNDE